MNNLYYCAKASFFQVLTPECEKEVVFVKVFHFLSKDQGLCYNSIFWIELKSNENQQS